METFSRKADLHNQVEGFVDYRDRSCSDIFCLLLFIASMFGVLFVYTASEAAGGNPNMIIRGVDFDGTICDGETPFAAWPSLVSFGIQICVADCDQTGENGDPRMITPHDSQPYISYCLPINLDENSTFAFQSTFAGAIADVYTTAWVIFASVFMATIFSFGFTYVIGACGKFIVVICSLGTVLCGALVSYAFFYEAQQSRIVGDEDTASMMEIVAYIFATFTLITSAVLCCIRKKLMLAVKLTNAAGQSVRDVPCAAFFPFVPLIIGCVYTFLWAVVALYVVSVSTEEEMPLPAEFLASPAWPEATYLQYSMAEGQETDAAYLFFHFLWVTEFLVFFNYLVVAGTISRWYFHPQNKEDLPSMMVTSSLARTCRFHLGSVAFGSFIIAVVQFLRAILKYIQEQTKDSDNKVAKCVVCCLRCCLSCLESCLDKVSKSAYSWIAPFGGNFCQGTCSAFGLMMENVAQTAAISWVGGTLLFVGKVFVALSTTGLSTVIISCVYEIESLIAPAAVIFILALLISHIFMLQLDVAVDSVFLCFLVDLKSNGGNIKFGTPALQKVINESNNEAKGSVSLSSNQQPLLD